MAASRGALPGAVTGKQAAEPAQQPAVTARVLEQRR